MNIIFLFPIIPSIVQILLFLLVFKEESPKFYIINQKFDRAKEIIEKLCPNEELLNTNKSEESFIDLKVSLYDQNWDGRYYSSLLKPKYLRAFLAGWLLSILQQLSGINIIIFYSSIPVTRDLNIIFVIILGSINFISTLVAIYLLKKFGRKELLLYGELAMAFTCSLLFLIAFPINPYTDSAYYFIVKWLFSFYVISFAMTLGPICWIYLAEIMTEKGMGIAVSINWFLVIIMSYLPSFSLMNTK